MLPIVTLDEARNRSWDVIVAGSSFAAMFFVLGLPRDLAVLMVEKGAIVPHDRQIATRHQNPERFDQRNTSDHPKEWVAHTLFGGNSNCWWACVPRFHPSDFRMNTFYGVGDDWPLGYDDLAPFYQAVEEVMDVNGGGSDAVLPRAAPFPYAPHRPSRSDRLLRGHAPNWWAQPSARANGGARATCCTNGVCDLCPVDSKFTILNSLDRFPTGNLSLLLDSEVRQVQIAGGRASGVEVRSGGETVTLSAGHVALAANAIFNAVILMRSGIDHPRLGRGLNEQLSAYVHVDGPGLGYYGGTSVTGHGYDLYDGPHRAAQSGVLLEVHNAPVSVREEPGKWTQRMRLKLIAEDLPRLDNRIVLDGDGFRIDWHGHDPYAWEGLRWGHARLPDILPGTLTISDLFDVTTTEKHAMGTHPFGTDPTRHVVDPDMKVHGISGLSALGSGVFPTTSPANPTLTLSALSLRAGRSFT